jgi:CRP-like cAMP-binding protein
MPAQFVVALPPEERDLLEGLLAAADTPGWKRRRAAIVLLLGVGMPTRAPGVCAYTATEIGERCGCTPATVTKIRREYAEQGLVYVLNKRQGAYRTGH